MSLYPSTTVVPSTTLFPEIGEQIADVCNYEVAVLVADYLAAAAMQTYGTGAQMQTYATDAGMQTYGSGLSATRPANDMSVMAYETAMEAELVLEVCD